MFRNCTRIDNWTLNTSPPYILTQSCLQVISTLYKSHHLTVGFCSARKVESNIPLANYKSAQLLCFRTLECEEEERRSEHRGLSSVRKISPFGALFT
eukprot:jgi/Botrbrau1/19898/Bobra.0059s0019.1